VARLRSVLSCAANESADPIFNKSVSFYLFTLPIYDSISSWLLYLAVIILIAAGAYAALAATQETVLASAKDKKPWRVGITVVSIRGNLLALDRVAKLCCHAILTSGKTSNFLRRHVHGSEPPASGTALGCSRTGGSRRSSV
jgi:uncharacterized membrane protein (UPF0182 family)